MAERDRVDKLVDKVYATALPIAMRANADLRCTSAIMGLVGSIAAPAYVLKINLDMISKLCVDDWQSLLRCDLVNALTCVLTSASARRDQFKIAVTSVHHILKGRHGWQQMATMSDMHGVLVSMALNPSMKEDEADALFDLIHVFVNKKDASVLSDFHYRDLTVAAVGHCACRAPVLRVIAQMSSFNLVCRYIFRSEVRANILLRCLVQSLSTGDDEVKAASECLCRLCDNDLHRTSEAMGPDLRARLVQTLIHNLKKGTQVQQSASVCIIRSLMRRGVTKFEGHPKYKRRTSDASHQPWILIWSRSLGSECIRLLSDVIQRTKCAQFSILGIHGAIQYLIQNSQVDRATYAAAFGNISSVLTYHIERGINMIVIRTLLNILVQLTLSSHEPLASLVHIRDNIKTCIANNPKFKKEFFGQTLYTYMANDDDERREGCSICFEDMKSDACTTCCGHTFHCSCVSNWFAVNNKRTCPMCRSSGLDVVSDDLSAARTP